MTDMTAKIAAQYSETTMLHDEACRCVVQIHTSTTQYVYCTRTSAEMRLVVHTRAWSERYQDIPELVLKVPSHKSILSHFSCLVRYLRLEEKGG